MNRYFFSIKFKLLALVVGIGLLMLVFIMAFLPPRIERLTADIMKHTAGADFIVRLLSDNLALGIEAMLLDDGASIDQTIELLNLGSKENLIDSIAIFDEHFQQIRATRADISFPSAYKHIEAPVVQDRANQMNILAPLYNLERERVGFMEIVFTKEYALKRTRRALHLIMLVGIAILLGGMGVAFLFVTRTITRPLQGAVEKFRKIAEGDLSVDVDIQRSDEIGQLLAAMKHMIEKIREVLRETDGLTQAVTEGRLRERGDVTSFSGGWRDLVHGINKVIDEFVSPINVLTESIKQVSRGNIPEPISYEYQGDFQEIREHVNMLIDSMNETTMIAEAIAEGNLDVAVHDRSEHDRFMLASQTMILRLNEIMTETKNMILAVQNGKLDVYGNADAFNGVWRQLIADMNSLITVLSKTVSEAASLNQEMALAQRIQTSLLPRHLDGIHPDFEIAAAMLPADEVGGDYYDIAYDRAQNFWLSIGDVSGHGMTPGLIMMMAQTVHTAVTANYHASPKEVVNAVNKVLYSNVKERMGADHFMTFNSLKYLGDGRFQHAGAHLSILVYRQRAQTCELLETSGAFLNFIPDISHASHNAEFSIDVGDLLVLYTDGLTEAMNADNELFDIHRFQDIIQRYADEDVETVKECVFQDVLKWCDGKQVDDMSLILIRRVQ